MREAEFEKYMALDTDDMDLEKLLADKDAGGESVSTRVLGRASPRYALRRRHTTRRSWQHKETIKVIKKPLVQTGAQCHRGLR